VDLQQRDALPYTRAKLVIEYLQSKILEGRLLPVNKSWVSSLSFADNTRIFEVVFQDMMKLVYGAEHVPGRCEELSYGRIYNKLVESTIGATLVKKRARRSVDEDDDDDV
jgi:hypothetical protein